MKIIGLIMARTNAKQKHVVFAWKSFVINQIKGILKTTCDDGISILFRNISQDIFPFPLKFSFWLFTTSNLLLFSLSKMWSLQVKYLINYKKLSIQILKISLILQLIIKITLTLICTIFVDSAVSTHLISQLAPVANK